eukprot:scpid63705/ scgid0791/ Putative ferric-chelate reductase 1 homolog
MLRVNPLLVAVALLLGTLFLPTCRSQLTWTSLTETQSLTRPSARHDFGFGYDPDKNTAYLFGGIADDGIKNDLWSLNLTSATWNRLGDAITPQPPARFSMLSGVYTQGPDTLFVISTGQGSGRVFFNDIWAYSVTAGSWKQLAKRGDVPDTRYGAAGGLHVNGTSFYVSHGFSNRRHSDTSRYDMREQRWIRIFSGASKYSSTKPHPRCRVGTTMAGVDEPVLYGGCLSGGFSGGPCPSVDSWALRGGAEWKRMEDCAAPSQFSGMARWPGGDGKVVMFGGLETDRSIITSKTSEYNEVDYLVTSSGAWKRLATTGADGSVPSLRHSHGMITITRGGTRTGVLVWGGVNSEQGNLDDMWLLTGNPETADTVGSCGPTWFLYMHLHGFFMIISWGILLIAGVFIARYFRDKDPLWFKLHRGLQIAGASLSFLGIILVFPGTRAVPNFAHGLIGALILIFSIQQIINGLMRPHKGEGEPPKKRVYWEYWHLWGGRLFLVLGAINISLGVYLILAPAAVIAIWFVIFAAWIVAFVVFEIKLQVLKRKSHAL